ncbi:hypothetical protein BDZ91DRAFT_793794 [Kalaharituber pfeilii]|nr:hypothetical protein BDZ91DRAFT_793794 [Kalaharituber pfeilii]
MSSANQELDSTMDLLDLESLLYEDFPTVFDRFPDLWERGFLGESTSGAAEDEALAPSNPYHRGQNELPQDVDYEVPVDLDELQEVTLFERRDDLHNCHSKNFSHATVNHQSTRRPIIPPAGL